MNCHNHPERSAVCLVQTQLTMDAGSVRATHVLFMGLCLPCYKAFIKEKVSVGFI
jgi:hypothetical protein